MQWLQNSNLPCTQTVYTCGFSAGFQNNWLITQLINRTVNGIRLQNVKVLIEFEQPDCNNDPQCQNSFTIHIYERSSEDSTAARNTLNYRTVQAVSPDGVYGVAVQQTIDITFNTNHTSFYFAIEDRNSCTAIKRMIVFYYDKVCHHYNNIIII